MLYRWTYIILFATVGFSLIEKCNCNLPPVFTQDMNNHVLSESIPVGTIVYKLEGYDPEGGEVSFGLIGSDNFMVDPKTGEIKIVKALDRESQDTLSFLVSIRDNVNVFGNSENDNIVDVPISVIVADENDNPPEFQNVPYEAEVLEDASVGTTVFSQILVTDKDSVGENLDINCVSQSQNLDACTKFTLELLETNQDKLTAAVVLKEKLDYNERMIYQIILSATDGLHTSSTGLEIRVKDVQNSPPVFQGSLAAVISEDSPIGTLVMTIQARDGDRGQPRKIIYELVTNPMDYFLLDSRTGELRTAKPLDKEALPDATGLIILSIRARELVDGALENDPLTVTSTQASVTIKDVNDSPPTFNQKEYFVSLSENTAVGTPLPLDMNVYDPDVGQNAIFSLRLDDVSGVFEVEPKMVTGSSQISIRVAKGSLDYENPNQRKFIVLIIAEETETSPKLSSTATLTVSITDANDNRPIFEQESYSAIVSETASGGQLITTITAKDIDSGHFGDQGIRYSLSGTGAELFNVDNITGAITVAKCPMTIETFSRHKRFIKLTDDDDDDDEDVVLSNENARKNVNVTYVGQTGILSIDGGVSGGSGNGGGSGSDSKELKNQNEKYVTYNNVNNPDLIEYKSGSVSDGGGSDEEHNFLSRHDSSEEEIITMRTITNNDAATNTNTNSIQKIFGPGKKPCLDFEAQSVYFLSYKATDDNGKGQTSVVSLRIQLLDANDSPPICESPLYRASLDEGASVFDPILIIKARDPDIISDINYRIIGSEIAMKFFNIDKRSGQLTVTKNTILDVNHLSSDNIFFSVEANDGMFSVLCNVNVTIRDVNNHAPQFSRDNYITSIAENTPIGTSIEQLNATDLDTSINAEIRYRMQQGSFDDFSIDNLTGIVQIQRTLDYDRRNTYQIEVLASDLGTPSLTGTTTLTVSILNSNDKSPYFTPTTQRTEVAEDIPVGTIVYTLRALDPDIVSSDALDYSATEPITAVDKDGKEVLNTEDFKDMFSIDRTGNVIVNNPLNRDLFAVVRITVLVTDTTAPSIQQGKGLLIITITDVNELPPVFALPWTPTSPKYTFNILEEQPIGTILTSLLATDVDSNIEGYQITDNDYFVINNQSGVIKTKSRIDFEHIKEIHFNVSVTDTGIPQLSSIAEITVNIINTNDNDPIFNASEYNMEIFENSPKGTIVGKVYANDNDDGILGEITYSLVGKQSAYFQIESDTGVITVYNSTTLDREDESEISLTVVATDKATLTTRRSSAVPVHIKVLDINDNPPIFTQKKYHATIAENAALNPPAAILQITATDRDEGASGQVKYFFISGNKDKTFRLDPDSGILYPGKSLLGLKGQYVIHVEARDGLGTGPNSDTAEIVIEIHSINHFRPVFIMPALSNATVELPENVLMADYLVMTVKASDNDTGDDGKVTYHLLINNQNVQETDEFIIDEITGELRTKKLLNRKERSRYELVLVARDQGSPAWFEILRFLTILLVDINENRPEFPDASNPYKFYIQENNERDIRVGKIQAMLQSKNPNAHVHYYFLLGNEDGAFYMDKITGDIFTNKTLDREQQDIYYLYILASKKGDLHITDTERYAVSKRTLERDSTIAKVWIFVLDVNDNAPVFEKDVYYAGINSKASTNELVTVLNATDKDLGLNGTLDIQIVASNLYKFGSTKTTGPILPSPFAITRDGRLTTATYMAEYNQDRFILEIIAKEVEQPRREAKAKVYIWIFNPEQLVRVIFSRPPSEVNEERDEIISELSNATQKRIVVDEIRYHIDGMGRIRMDWCDLYFHAIDPTNNQIAPVDEILKVIDSHYDFLKDYYAGFAIENVVPAHSTYVEEEFDLALAALIALIIVLFVGAVSFIVLCCCLKHWVISIPAETRRKDQLIKKQIIEDLNTTENPLWVEQKLKLYEEQELTMQVFSELESSGGIGGGNGLNTPSIHEQPLQIDTLGRRDSYETSQCGGDNNTYATIQPRNLSQMGDLADYATLRDTPTNNPSMYEFTGSTFQVQQRDRPDFVTELM